MSDGSINQIRVGIIFDEAILPVGRLALRDARIYFEYESSFLDGGLEISPLKCPLRSGVQTFDGLLFDGLPGVFNDSLPDGWGRLLLDRQVRVQGILPNELSALDRLAYVGHTGMGALVYEPDNTDNATHQPLDLKQLADHAAQVLEGSADGVVLQPNTVSAMPTSP